MNVIRTIMNARPEKQKEVLQTLLLMTAPFETEKGCLSYGIYKDIRDKNVFILISEWNTREQLNHHIQSDGFSVLLGIKSLLIELLKIKIFTVSGIEEMEAVNTLRNKINETDYCHMNTERSREA